VAGALDAVIDGAGGGVEDGGDFVVGEVLDGAEDERFAEVFGEEGEAAGETIEVGAVGGGFVRGW
jgi:hypothetical protein